MNSLLGELRARKVKVWVEGDDLHLNAPKGALDEELRQILAANKQDLIEVLRGAQPQPSQAAQESITVDPKHRFDPFPLTDVQFAYWTGRSGLVEAGNVSTHLYFELEAHEELDADRLSASFRTIIDRHEMLRAIVRDDGQQVILEQVPPFEIGVLDCRGQGAEAFDAAVAETRAAMSHEVLPADQWPVFSFRLTRGDRDRMRLHCSIDLLIIDGWSIFQVFNEWFRVYQNPSLHLPPLELSFRDYVLAERRIMESAAADRAREYWQHRVMSLPPSPELPLRRLAAAQDGVRFNRRQREIGAEAWSVLVERSRKIGLTPSSLLLGAFAQLLTRWSRSPRFTLNLTMFNRLPLHEQVDDIVGDFTTLVLLEVDNTARESFKDRALRLQQQLWQDLEHREVSGVQVMRDWAKINGQQLQAAMPVVFTSALALNTMGDFDVSALESFGEMVYGVSQTPQVWFDHQVLPRRGGLVFNWDVTEDLFPAGYLDSLLESYLDLLDRLARTSTSWEEVVDPALPASQLQLIEQANDTDGEVPTACLHSLFLEQAARTPAATAVIAKDRELSYAEVELMSRRLARRLTDHGAEPNSLVAVVMEKGWEQIVATLGIMMAGAAYLPIEPDHPEDRRWQLLREGEARLVVTQPHLHRDLRWPETNELIVLEYEAENELHEGDLLADDAVHGRQTDLAYVIFTSGSTGVPKGVMIDHRGAVNTVVDINERFAVGPGDRVLAVSALNFDLSVYDVFGTLAAGATIVMPDPETRLEPEHWAELMAAHGVTIWNSAPPLMQMLVNSLDSQPVAGGEPLRLVLLSGDWIALALPEQITQRWPNARPISLGGATEGSIWSICYPITAVEQGWASIPYGKALKNQKMYVLNEHLDHCPMWVTGQIHIGGVGVAKGYWKDSEKTVAHFFDHPVTGEPLYATGDLGRLLPSGDIEFLGREDSQVKINGHRVELGEIASHLCQHPSVLDAVAIAEGKPRRLTAFVVPEIEAQLLLEDGDLDDETVDGGDVLGLRSFLETRLPAHMVPRDYVMIDMLPISPTGKVDYKVLKALVEEETSAERQITGPKTLLESQLLEIWKEVINLDEIGVDENFFEIGGDSVRATKVISEVRKQLGIKLPLRSLFKSPTIQSFARDLELPDADTDSLLLDDFPPVVHDPEHRFEPFPFSDLQVGFYLGGQNFMEYQVRPHYYLELNYPELDIDRYHEAWRRALERHLGDIAVISPDVQLQPLKEIPPFSFSVTDLRGLPAAVVEQKMLEKRAVLERTELPADGWSWFELEITLHDDGVRIHSNFNNFYMDGQGTMVLLNLVRRLYENPDREVPAMEITARDCVLALEELSRSERGQRARKYWNDRLSGLPEAPPIPVLPSSDRRCRAQLERRKLIVPPDQWRAFKKNAGRMGVTPTNATTAVFAEVLSVWSGSDHFIINNMATHRFPMHPQIMEVLGNFASLYPLEVDLRGTRSFAERVSRVQDQLMADMQHLSYSGMAVWQDYNRALGNPGKAPCPFVNGSGLFMEPLAGTGYACLETCQVILDHQYWQLADGGNYVVWDLIEEVFPPGMIDAMWSTYQDLIKRLSESEKAWQEQELIRLPADQLATRQAANQTEGPRAEVHLHSSLPAREAAGSERPAVIAPSGTLSYGELAAQANRIGRFLREAGVRPSELVAVIAEHDPAQVASVLGVLAGGGAYVPIDPGLPEERIKMLLETTGARFALTQGSVKERIPAGVVEQVLCVDSSEDLAEISDAPLDPVQGLDELAYVIFTSGSTGVPKGVMISHRAAMNTLEDINRRFQVGPDDRVFGISSLSFDLSVYDIFGIAAAGGALVLPEPAAARSPNRWIELLIQERVTIWNSVPALMQLLVDATGDQENVFPDLRLVLLSGDWIPVTLPDRIHKAAPNAEVISLGGATEASVWSIFYPIASVDTQWQSIPYGKPLTNQHWKVLGRGLRDCPTWVPGHLYIGGSGLAMGYLADAEKTAASFFEHPQTGERLYRTGDLGRYLPDGNLEFLGRDDFQVKIQGFRIELGEIEAHLLRHPGIGAAAAVVEDLGAQGKRIVSYVVAAEGHEGKLDEESVLEHARSSLPEYMVPVACEVLETMSLTANGKVDRKALRRTTVRIEQPLLTATERVAPRDSLERELAEVWQEILDVETIGVEDDFFALGGHSFAAVRVLARVEKLYGRRMAPQAILEGRTVANLAGKIRAAAAGRQTWSPLVQLSAEGSGPPVFFAHPAAGGVIRYRKLAEMLDNPVYAMQAQGLDCSQQALETLEEMGELYVKAILDAVPEGPYIIGGFCLGGFVAFEMVRQLEQHGAEVALLVNLDGHSPVEVPIADEASLALWFLEDLNQQHEIRSDLVEEVRKAPDGQKLQWLVENVGGFPEGFDLATLTPLYNVFRGMILGCQRYRPQKIKSNFLMVRATGTAVNEFAKHPDFDDPTWGWGRLTSGPSKVEHIPGEHYLIFEPQYIDALAAALKPHLAL